MFNHATVRTAMVESQLRTNKVTDVAILEAYETIPREAFLPEGRAGIAYIDEDIEVAPGRFLLEPMVQARLLQAAQIGDTDVVLDLGCATGYSSALLSRLAGTVVALESDPDLAGKANQILEEQGFDNAVVVQGNLTQGYPKQAPYNVILLGGAVAEIPQSILDQLADGGRLVGVLRDRTHLGQAILVCNNGGRFSRRTLFDAATPILPGFAPRPRFVF